VSNKFDILDKRSQETTTKPLDQTQRGKTEDDVRSTTS
jgi:hypothetical protein